MKTITLKKPIIIRKDKDEDKTIDSLSFREHTTAADYLSFDRMGAVEQRIALIASVAGTDEALIKRLSGADYLRCSHFVDELLLADETAASDTPDAENLTSAQKATQEK